jgi:hypothetical protein
MPRKTDRQAEKQSPILAKKLELERKAAQLSAELNQTRDFLKKVPDLKAAAQQRRQKETLDRHTRPTRIEGPADFRLEFTPGKPLKPPRRLRKDRSKAPLITFLLLVAFGIVVYYAWCVLLQN